MAKLSIQFYQARKRTFEDRFLTGIDYWVEGPMIEITQDGEPNPRDEEVGWRALDLYSSNMGQTAINIISTMMKAKSEEASKGLLNDDVKLTIAIFDHQALEDPVVINKLFGIGGREKGPNQKNEKEESALLPKKKAALRRLSPSNTRKLDEDYVTIPMLILGVDDIMGAYHRDTVDLRKDLDPRFRFWDSSIWHRYVSLGPSEIKISNSDISEEIPSFSERLRQALIEMFKCAEHGLYNTIIAREYLEFQGRKLINSYVMNVMGGHAKKVTPFRFHSETKMKELAKKQHKNINLFSWRVLLVDDYADKPLRSILSTSESDAKAINTDGIPTNKNNWIDLILNEGKPEGEKLVTFLDTKWEERNNNFLTEGIKLIHKERPDIIILDYFFGLKEQNLEEQYGHKLIKRLKEEHEINDEDIQPHGKYWVFPISAFEHAFKSHLRTMGESMGGEDMVIGDGADPINSPELFRYLFYSFLAFQRHEVAGGFDQLIQKLHKGICEEKNDVKGQFIKHYNDITQTTSKVLHLNEVANKLPLLSFASSFLKVIDPKKLLTEIAIHTQSLGYLISFGSGRDWPRMWAELRLIKELSEKYFLSGEDTEEQKQLDVLLKEIEVYISTLLKRFP
ncbi:MAG: hypothetical protein AAF388_02035 [Bacteroidota bacterium]